MANVISLLLALYICSGQNNNSYIKLTYNALTFMSFILGLVASVITLGASSIWPVASVIRVKTSIIKLWLKLYVQWLLSCG